MANETGHGGYRRPADPAPVSGPGKHSQRTDGGPEQPKRYLQGNGEYGDSKSLNEAAAGAPMAAAPGPTPPPEGFVPFGMPTQRPEEPETYGSPEGEGPGPSPLSFQNDDYGMDPLDAFDPIADAIRGAYMAEPTEELLVLVERLEADGR